MRNLSDERNVGGSSIIGHIKVLHSDGRKASEAAKPSACAERDKRFNAYSTLWFHKKRHKSDSVVGRTELNKSIDESKINAKREFESDGDLSAVDDDVGNNKKRAKNAKWEARAVTVHGRGIGSVRRMRLDRRS